MNWLLAAVLSTSINFGEHIPAPVYSLSAVHPRVEQTIFWDTTDKYTGAGYILGYDADIRVASHLIVGFDFHYRSGGEWSKSGWAIRAGVGGTGYALLIRQTFYQKAVDESRGVIGYIHAPIYKRLEIITFGGAYYFPLRPQSWSYLYKLGLGYRIE